MNKETTLPIFPFSAIIGQEEMKLALQLNVIDPKIGGVMIMGDRYWKIYNDSSNCRFTTKN
jgi:Mg-chelatase subunit ChlI